MLSKKNEFCVQFNVKPKDIRTDIVHAFENLMSILYRHCVGHDS
jgi:hypothetical protein